MAKKKVKKYHQGGSHEDHHVQSRPIPKEKIVGGPPGSGLEEERKDINKANQKKAGMVPAMEVPGSRPPPQRIPFAPTVRPQPITVGGPKQVQPMPTQRPAVVGVTPRPLAQPQPMRQLPSRRLTQPTRRPSRQQLIDVFGRMINENERQGRTASRVNPNAVLGTPRRRRRR